MTNMVINMYELITYTEHPSYNENIHPTCNNKYMEYIYGEIIKIKKNYE